MDLSSIQGGQQAMDFAEKMMGELKTDLLTSLTRLAEQNATTEDNVQLAIRFTDAANGDGELYYEIFVGWKPLRRAHFGKDFLGNKTIMPDLTGKEGFIRAYLIGIPGLNIEGQLTKIAEKYNVTQWSNISGMFYKTKTGKIMLGVYIKADGKNEQKEKFDLFAAPEAIAPETAAQVETK